MPPIKWFDVFRRSDRGEELPVVIAVPESNSVLSGTIAAIQQSITLNVPAGVSAIGVEISGTWIGQLEFEAIIQNSWVSVYASNTATSTNAVTANGIFILPGAGYQRLRLRSSAWTSGVAVINFNASIGAGPSLLSAPLPAGTNAIGSVTNAMLGAATSDAAIITDATGTIHQYLRGLVKLAITAGSFLVRGSVASGGIASGAVASGAVASGAVASGAIASGAVAAGAVSAGAVVNGAVLSGAFATGAITDLPAQGQAVMAASVPVTMASDQSAVPVKGAGNVITQTPTITAGVYHALDAVGGLLTFALAVRAAAGLAVVESVVVIDLAKQNADLELFLFDRTFTPTADNAAFDPSDADLANYVGHIDIGAGRYKSLADNSVATITDQPLLYKLAAAGTSIFGQLRCSGTPTYVTTTDLTVKLGVRYAD